MKPSQLAAIASSVPSDWQGTTYNNSDLLGRHGFTERLEILLASTDTPTTSQLEALGNAEDYLRVSSNLSCVLEFHLAQTSGAADVDHVFSFASQTFPIVAAAMAAAKPIKLTGANPFSEQDETALAALGIEFGDGGIVLAVVGDVEETYVPDLAEFQMCDGVVSAGVLYIVNPQTIPQGEVLIRRKRMSTPFTNPHCLHLMQLLGGQESDYVATPADEELDEFLTHLQTMSGASADPNNLPVTFIAGLPALSALWFALAQGGGFDIVMASTAYGGSSQVADLFSQHNKSIRKKTFDVQGDAQMVEEIRRTLDEMKTLDNLAPTTVLCIEIPTNPDMKVPDLTQLCEALSQYRDATNNQVLLVVDSTFAPTSQVLARLRETDKTLSAICFVSMSKSISRGHTCAGALVANHHPHSQTLLKDVRAASIMLDTAAMPDQLDTLCANHRCVEQRCDDAYQIAETIGRVLCEAVLKHTNTEMPLAFVSKTDAANGFTSSTFSFNLVPPTGASQQEAAELAQKFVDILQQDTELFKACVSFGQDNGKVYATVPATSTQGAIEETSKAKQAKSGVQLTRLSFPPTIDMQRLEKAFDNAIEAVYS